MQGITYEDLEKRFKHHSPTPEVGDKLSTMRKECLALAKHIKDETPAGREQSVAITKLEEVMFWANAALARN